MSNCRQSGVSTSRPATARSCWRRWPSFSQAGVRPSWFTLNISCPNTDDDPRGLHNAAQVSASLRAICPRSRTDAAVDKGCARACTRGSTRPCPQPARKWAYAPSWPRIRLPGLAGQSCANTPLRRKPCCCRGLSGRRTRDRPGCLWRHTGWCQLARLPCAGCPVLDGAGLARASGCCAYIA